MTYEEPLINVVPLANHLLREPEFMPDIHHLHVDKKGVWKDNIL